jgi:hypothetical protein
MSRLRSGVMNVIDRSTRRGETAVFTVDSDNNIAMPAGSPARSDNLQSFAEKDTEIARRLDLISHMTYHHPTIP